MYTYAFLTQPSPSLELPKGIEDQVQIVGTEALFAAVEPELSETKLSLLQEKDESLMQAVISHDRVIRELFLQTTILPLRFGTHFASLQGLLTHLDARQQDYLQTLSRFDGKVEYILKLTPVEALEESIPSGMKGKDYFLAKKKQYQAQLERKALQQTEQAALLQQLAGVSLQYRLSHQPTDDAKVYLLTSRDEARQLFEQIDRWQNQCSYWKLSLGEALPPYHFLEN